MPYRTRRERRYRKRAAKAAAALSHPKTAGGWGKDAPIRPADLQLLRRAIRERWPVPEHVRLQIVDTLHLLLGDDETRERTQWAIVLAAVKMEGRNQQLEFQSLPREWQTN